jgi:hypothetical protein
MFKSIVKAALFGAFQRWWSAPAAQTPSPIHLDTDELKSVAIKIGTLVTLSFLNFLLFVGAIVVTVVAVAHSFDVYDQFVATSVFWTGLIMGITALVVGGICGWALLHVKIEPRKFLVTQPVVENTFDFRERLLNPFLEGLTEGFRKDRPAENRFDRTA